MKLKLVEGTHFYSKTAVFLRGPWSTLYLSPRSGDLVELERIFSRNFWHPFPLILNTPGTKPWFSESLVGICTFHWNHAIGVFNIRVMGLTLLLF